MVLGQIYNFPSPTIPDMLYNVEASKNSSTGWALWSHRLSFIQMTTELTAPMKKKIYSSKTETYSLHQSQCLLWNYGRVCEHATQCLYRPSNIHCQNSSCFLGHWRTGRESLLPTIWKYLQSHWFGWSRRHNCDESGHPFLRALNCVISDHAKRNFLPTELSKTLTAGLLGSSPVLWNLLKIITL